VVRCAAINVVRSMARIPALTLDSRDRVLQRGWRHQSLCIKAVSMSGFRVQLGILCNRLNIVLVIVSKGDAVLAQAMKVYRGTKV
jgi:hypothetical protein